MSDTEEKTTNTIEVTEDRIIYSCGGNGSHKTAMQEAYEKALVKANKK